MSRLHGRLVPRRARVDYRWAPPSRRDDKMRVPSDRHGDEFHDRTRGVWKGVPGRYWHRPKDGARRYSASLTALLQA